MAKFVHLSTRNPDDPIFSKSFVINLLESKTVFNTMRRYQIILAMVKWL